MSSSAAGGDIRAVNARLEGGSVLFSRQRTEVRHKVRVRGESRRSADAVNDGDGSPRKGFSCDAQRLRYPSAWRRYVNLTP